MLIPCGYSPKRRHKNHIFFSFFKNYVIGGSLGLRTGVKCDVISYFVAKYPITEGFFGHLTDNFWGKKSDKYSTYSQNIITFAAEKQYQVYGRKNIYKSNADRLGLVA